LAGRFAALSADERRSAVILCASDDAAAELLAVVPRNGNATPVRVMAFTRFVRTLMKNLRGGEPVEALNEAERMWLLARFLESATAEITDASIRAAWTCGGDAITEDAA